MALIRAISGSGGGGTGQLASDTVSIATAGGTATIDTGLSSITTFTFSGEGKSGGTARRYQSLYFDKNISSNSYMTMGGESGYYGSGTNARVGSNASAWCASIKSISGGIVEIQCATDMPCDGFWMAT